MQIRTLKQVPILEKKWCSHKIENYYLPWKDRLVTVLHKARMAYYCSLESPQVFFQHFSANLSDEPLKPRVSGIFEAFSLPQDEPLSVCRK